MSANNEFFFAPVRHNTFEHIRISGWRHITIESVPRVAIVYSRNLLWVGSWQSKSNEKNEFDFYLRISSTHKTFHYMASLASCYSSKHFSVSRPTHTHKHVLISHSDTRQITTNINMVERWRCRHRRRRCQRERIQSFTREREELQAGKKSDNDVNDDGMERKKRKIMQ